MKDSEHPWKGLYQKDSDLSQSKGWKIPNNISPGLSPELAAALDAVKKTSMNSPSSDKKDEIRVEDKKIEVKKSSNKKRAVIIAISLLITASVSSVAYFYFKNDFLNEDRKGINFEKVDPNAPAVEKLKKSQATH